MNKKNTPIINIGATSMLVIFIILCLTTFATLSLSSAKSDYNFSKKIATRTTAYYKASNKAMDIRGEINTILANTFEQERGTYFTSASKALEQMDGLNLDFSLSTPLISYSIKIDDSKALYVVLALSYPEQSNDAYYHIQTWQEVSTKEWSGDNKLHLISFE
ncbi:hypothetical protein ACTQ6A_15290 [Lachnospiraceae bacterium LCP25S3_G4]